VFVDIKTAWIIDGIGHGHQALQHETTDDGLLLQKTEGRVTASAAVLPYTEITPQNLSSFHFHGDEAKFPISAVIANPHSRRDQTLLLGRYASVRQETAQCVKPAEVVQDLLSIVFRVEQLVWISSLLAAIVTALLLGLVLLLSIRLREAEMQTMFKLGCSRLTIVTLLSSEVLLMTLAGVTLALSAAWISQAVGSSWLKSLLF
jgi:putative ABC transport system permease protein